MSLRRAIILMSGLAVVSDAVLIAFYPQFFEQRYGVRSSVAVGAYIAAISLAVMCTLPAWARVARRVDTLRLIVWTQFAAGTLCVASHWAGSALGYCLLTLPMFMCKSSYLLMFPYLMRREPPQGHAATVGLLSVVVHVGSIFGSVAGGFVMERYGPAACVWLMAAGDFAQLGICRHLIRSGRVPKLAAPASSAMAPESPDGAGHRGASSTGVSGRVSRMLRLCLLMGLFDFSAHLAGPFFARLWERVSASSDAVIAGTVFAIPGMLALLAMLVNRRCEAGTLRKLSHLQFNLLLGAAGMVLQALPHEAPLLIGRCLFGWAIFQAIVRLEVSVFELSRPESYAADYSVANFFQNLGVLLSSFAAGAIVERWGVPVTFLLGACGLSMTALLDRAGLGLDRLRSASEATRGSLSPGAHAHGA